MSAKFELEPAKFLQTVKATIFDPRATEEELIAFLVVCNRYELDPFRKEIYAFRQGDKIQPIVGIDGWSSIVNRHDKFDGVDFSYKFDDKGLLFSTTCEVYRKDRLHPIVVTEFLSECKRNTPPWNTMPARMLRHRAYIQAMRLAFGISGIMDPDEFEQMVEVQATVKAPPTTLADLTKQIKSEQSAVGSQRSEPPQNPASSPAPVAAEPTTPPAAPALFTESTKPKLSSNAGLFQAIEGYKAMIGEELFVATVKKAGGVMDLEFYGLGRDSLRSLLDSLSRTL